MVKLQWPIKIKKDKKDMSESLEKELKIEAGLTRIKGSEFLMKRTQFTDKFLTDMCSVLREQVKSLTEKKNKSQQDKDDLEFKTSQLANFEAYRTLKNSGMQWSIAGEDNDMSERFSAYEKVFARNWNNPVYQDLLFACAQYLLDISYREKHVEPAPSIWVQMPTSGARIDLSSDREEKE